jgi:hypothetical protein
MMKTKRFVIPLLLCILLIGCLPPTVSVRELGELRKGMNETTVVQIMRHQPLYRFVLEEFNRPVWVDVYRLNTGGAFADYFLAFQDYRLVFWGYPHEFARSQDETINSMGKRAVANLHIARSRERNR